MIPSEKPRILVVGMEELPALTALRLRQAGFEGARVAEGARGGSLWREAGCADVFHAVYPNYYFKWVPVLKVRRKKVVFHWIGSDFYALRASRALTAAFRVIKAGVDLHVADAPWLIEELAAFGVRASLVPTISEKMRGEVEPMPARFRVLAYVPDRRRDFYGWPTVRHVAEVLPAVEIVAVAGTAAAAAPPNIRWTGYLDAAGMDAAYRECGVLIRPTAHDGLSQMVLEALLRGRQVVWTRVFPHCRHAQSPAAFAAAVADLAAACPANIEGAVYVREHYSAAAASRALAQAYGLLGPVGAR